nr:MAG TPA: hypothetical protein [Caudoviricetes sp.]
MSTPRVSGWYLEAYEGALQGCCVGAVDRVDWRHAKRMRETTRSRINITRVE